MNPAYETGSVKVYIGDCLAVLRELPAESIDTCVTSPPYYGLRDYATNTVWDGGDPACDHTKPFVPRSERPSGGSSIGKGSAYNDAQDAGKLAYRDICERCGARRVEPTIWPGDGVDGYGVPDGPCEHEWSWKTRPGMSGGTESEKVQIKGEDNFQAFAQTLHGSCVKCGAWRGQLGLEPTPSMYVDHLVLIFREVRRVLRDHGTVWLNIGDSYSAGGRNTYDPKGGKTSQTRGHQVPRVRFTGRRDAGRETPGGRGGSFRGGPAEPWLVEDDGVKPKDMLLIPARVAIALRDDGWYLRSDIIWSKPNAMPESVTDRPTKAHEYIWLLAKNEKYFYDAHAIREPFSEGSFLRLGQAGFASQTGGPKDYATTGVNANRSARKTMTNVETLIRHANAYQAWTSALTMAAYAAGFDDGSPDEYKKWRDEWTAANPPPERGDDGPAPIVGGLFPELEAVAAAAADPSTTPGQEQASSTPREVRWDKRHDGYDPDALAELGGRNKRSVWTIATAPYPEAHFATFPPELPRVCILAGCPEQVCTVCGKARERITEQVGAASTTRPQAIRAREIAAAAGLTDAHLAAVRSIGRADATKAQATMTGAGNNADETQRLADEAKTALGGYFREWSFGASSTTGFTDCGHDSYERGTVLDPFAGSGTTLQVARDLGRQAVGIELSEEYLKYIQQRTMQEALL